MFNEKYRRCSTVDASFRYKVVCGMFLYFTTETHHRVLLFNVGFNHLIVYLVV